VLIVETSQINISVHLSKMAPPRQVFKSGSGAEYNDEAAEMPSGIEPDSIRASTGYMPVWDANNYFEFKFSLTVIDRKLWTYWEYAHMCTCRCRWWTGLYVLVS
jgi:hypothetical protein